MQQDWCLSNEIALNGHVYVGPFYIAQAQVEIHDAVINGGEAHDSRSVIELHYGAKLILNNVTLNRNSGLPDYSEGLISVWGSLVKIRTAHLQQTTRGGTSINSSGGILDVRSLNINTDRDTYPLAAQGSDLKVKHSTFHTSVPAQSPRKTVSFFQPLTWKTAIAQKRKLPVARSNPTQFPLIKSMYVRTTLKSVRSV